jgi:hypothetical protein
MEAFIFWIAVITLGLCFIGPRFMDWLQSMRATPYDDSDDYPETVEQRFRKASGEDA